MTQFSAAAFFCPRLMFIFCAVLLYYFYIVYYIIYIEQFLHTFSCHLLLPFQAVSLFYPIFREMSFYSNRNIWSYCATTAIFGLYYILLIIYNYIQIDYVCLIRGSHYQGKFPFRLRTRSEHFYLIMCYYLKE